MLVESVEIGERAFATNQFITSMWQSLLAMTYQLQGKHDKAESLYRHSMETSARIFGTNHPVFFSSGQVPLATLYYQRNQHDKALSLLRQSADANERFLDAMTSSAGELELLATGAALQHRSQIDALVGSATKHEQYASEAYRRLIRFKGQSLIRQRLLRDMADEPGTRDAWRELEQTATDLAAHTRQQPQAVQVEAWQSQLQRLTTKLARLESQLAGSGAAYRAAKALIMPEQIVASLPAEVALVDFWRYQFADYPEPGKSAPLIPKTCLAAFVVRHGQPLKMINLGVAKPIREAVEIWRKDLAVHGRASEPRTHCLTRS